MQVDVIGVPFKELLHPDDQTDLKGLLAISPDELIQSHMNKKGMFVLKIRTIVSATIKSESRIQYKERMISGNPMRASVRQKRTAAVESKPLKAELLEDLSKFVKWLVIKTFQKREYKRKEFPITNNLQNHQYSFILIKQL